MAQDQPPPSQDQQTAEPPYDQATFQNRIPADQLTFLNQFAGWTAKDVAGMPHPHDPGAHTNHHPQAFSAAASIAGTADRWTVANELIYGKGTVMPIAKLILEIEIPHAQSLKDRRQVVRSMKDKLKHSFNVSVAELDDAMVWNRATIGMAAISNSTTYLTGQMTAIDVAAHRIVAGLSAEILDSYSELVGD